jgi:predicted nucleic acid-binding protein
VHALALETHEAGLRLAECHGLSTHDALIVASALQAGSRTLSSEDMQDGTPLREDLRTINPFRTAD